MFITLEGMEGSGKSTQLDYIISCLHNWGVPYIRTREPGGTYIGSQIRSILLDIKNTEMAPLSELLLCIADRIQHIKELIEFGLNNRFVIVCDRYVDSTLVYQGVARGIDLSIIWGLHKTLCQNIMPDLTLLMDLDPELSLSRTHKRLEKSMIRFEREKIEFHRKIREGYLNFACLYPNRYRLIDASICEEKISSLIKGIVKRKLDKDGWI